jgi:hypothetical protein
MALVGLQALSKERTARPLAGDLPRSPDTVELPFSIMRNRFTYRNPLPSGTTSGGGDYPQVIDFINTYSVICGAIIARSCMIVLF